MAKIIPHECHPSQMDRMAEYFPAKVNNPVDTLAGGRQQGSSRGVEWPVLLSANDLDGHKVVLLLSR
ncbi:MAG TPA: hypothetical protein DEO70_06250 [Bacteroidales bacterium]|nr:MAG: hypothetical protein A2X11_08295 [Bacteroidetes bacterium GWE2_42_24]OFY31096.1 MAG: hypothetical protein A2X09_15480 [Bacteroidetes bacterium GWF2_43_11]HBZ66422.1 hypothetical protein [Bacteroidales bacterium]